MSDVPGLVFVVAIAVLGFASVVVGTVRAWMWLEGHHVPVPASVALTILFAILAFLGFWLLLDVYWMVRAGLRVILRARVTPAEPST